MIGQVQLAFLLTTAVLVHANVAPPTVEQNLLTDGRSFEKVYIVFLDKIFDTLQPQIRNFILKHGLDPMELLDISESLLPFMPGKLKGSLDLKKGWLQGMSRVMRAKHIIATYTKLHKRIVLDMDLGFDVLDFNYEYYVKYLLARRQGDVNGRFYNIDLKVIITIDLNNFHINLDHLKFIKVRKYEINLEGHLLDPILNLANRVITAIFRNQILPHIEDRAFKMFREIFKEWNKKIPRPNRKQFIEEWFYNNMFNMQFLN